MSRLEGIKSARTQTDPAPRNPKVTVNGSLLEIVKGNLRLPTYVGVGISSSEPEQSGRGNPPGSSGHRLSAGVFAGTAGITAPRGGMGLWHNLGRSN